MSQMKDRCLNSMPQVTPINSVTSSQAIADIVQQQTRAGHSKGELFITLGPYIQVTDSFFIVFSFDSSLHTCFPLHLLSSSLFGADCSAQKHSFKASSFSVEVDCERRDTPRKSRYHFFFGFGKCFFRLTWEHGCA